MLVPLPLLAPTYPPTDPRLVLIGRFDLSDPTAAACQWSASEVRLRLRGSTLVATINEAGQDRLQVVVDGKPTEVLTLASGTTDYTISLGADAVHSVRLVKRTEPLVGTVRFMGFDVPGGGLFQARRRPKLVEFVGDSITCGYGIEGASQNDHFLPETENAYLSFASVAARALDADVRVLAWSGRKMWPDNTMPEVFDRVLPTQPAPLAASDEVSPDAVVINLATNDFARENPPEREWTAAYEAFIRRLWLRAPGVPVYVTLGSMLTDEHPLGTKALSTARGDLQRMVVRMHDPKVRFLEFDKQRLEDGIGADWHPNVVTEAKMGERLADAMKRDLGW